MKFISRENIDCQKWDDLVAKTTGASVFSLSSYLDEIAENWMVYVDENYTKGIAVPFAVRLGVKTCYTPIFITNLEWLGENVDDLVQFSMEVKDLFPIGNFCLRQPLVELNSEEFIEQIIPSDSNLSLGSQAKRMINKSEKQAYRITYTSNKAEIFSLIRSELLPKISSLSEASIQRLEKSMDKMSERGHLQVLSVFQGEQCLGGLLLIDFNQTVLYLKGAFTDEAKKNGAMYAAMNSAIQQAKLAGKNFDFGGSRVEGVRHFNLQLGGMDRVYYYHQWDNSPFWYRWVKQLRKALRN
ncbi:MAG: GNAT family N-acetyltransferase [Cryomorphaceae bacterium]|jgi:hypothetical protein|nr:GNAT family N-acetyltransferase [Cryomorphaceae bacterium]